MQNETEKTLYLRLVIGKVLKNIRMSRTTLSANKFANEYDLGNGNISRIENGKINCKILSLWKIANALNIKPSELIAQVEKELGSDFTLIDE